MSLKKELIKYFKELGIDVYTNTKARGHQGFFLKNRIDISKNIKEERIIPTLLHEFAHYIHNKIEPAMAKTGGSLEVLFALNDADKDDCKNSAPEVIQKTFFGFTFPKKVPPNKVHSENESRLGFLPQQLSVLEKELLAVTNFVDEQASNQRLITHKEQMKKKIKLLEAEIKKYYPMFMRSKKFKEFDKYIKKSKARYLLRYDRVQYVSPKLLGFLKMTEVFTIDNLERDFPEMPTAFCAYIRLKSAQRKQRRISARINKYNKYYSKPAELFARFVEGLYMDEAQIKIMAPTAAKRFSELLNSGHYFELKNVFEILNESRFCCGLR